MLTFLADPLEPQSVAVAKITPAEVLVETSAEIRVAQVGGDLRRPEQSTGSAGFRTTQACGLLPARHGIDRRPAAQRADSRILQIVSDGIIGAEGRLGAMPGSTVGSSIEHLRENRMGLLPATEPRRLVDRRPHQRMAEPHALPPELDQPGVHRGFEIVDADRLAAQERRCLDQLGHAVAVIQRREEEEIAGSALQLRGAECEGSLEPIRHGQPALTKGHRR